MSHGYAGKILRLNLTQKSVSIIDTARYEQWVGGHGIGSAIFWDLCEDKAITGFDPRNVVTIMTSPLAGTLSPASSRCEVQGIGPQGYPIEWFTRSGFGGRFASQLKYAGWDGIVIEGRAEAPVWINIVNDLVTFEDARGLWGLNTRETQEDIWRKVTGDRLNDWQEVGSVYTTQKPAVVCIGQAGENLSRVAVLMHDAGHAAGQGGFGGVFGSKNLKAISVIGTNGVRIANPQALMEALLWHRGNFQYNVDNPRHESPIPNFAEYCISNSAPGSVALTAVTEPSRPHGCQNCAMACSRRTESGLSNDSHCMTTIWPVMTVFRPGRETFFDHMGEYPLGQIEPSELGELMRSRFRLTDQVQQYGLNAFEILAGDIYLVTLYSMGVLGPGKAIDCDLPFDKWSTAEFKEAYLRMIAYREGIGHDLAEGVTRAAEKWGRHKQDTDSGLLHYLCWGYMEHDPIPDVEWAYGSVLGERDVNEHGIHFPVHHIARNAELTKTDPILSAERIAQVLSRKVLPYEGDPFMFDYSDGPTGIYSANRAKTIAWHRHYGRFWLQSVEYCDIVWPDFINPNARDMLGATPEGEQKFFNAVTGKGMSFVDGMEIGRRIWNLDRAIWALQGRHRDMEVLSGYVYSVPTKRSHLLPVYEKGEWNFSDCIGRTLDWSRFEEWKTKYFELEGWDVDSGWPTRNTLEGLELGEVADELEKSGRLGKESDGV
jgi:aldehyde:ferredoxin oxidoreductase